MHCYASLCFVAFALASRICRSSVLQASQTVKHEVTRLIEKNVRVSLDDVSLEELETIHKYLKEAQGNIPRFLETQSSIHEAVCRHINCQSNNLPSLDRSKANTRTVPWNSSASSSIFLDDEFVGAVGLPQRMVYLPKFLSVGDLLTVENTVPADSKYVMRQMSTSSFYLA